MPRRKSAPVMSHTSKVTRFAPDVAVMSSRSSPSFSSSPVVSLQQREEQVVISRQVESLSAARTVGTSAWRTLCCSMTCNKEKTKPQYTMTDATSGLILLQGGEKEVPVTSCSCFRTACCSREEKVGRRRFVLHSQQEGSTLKLEMWLPCPEDYLHQPLHILKVIQKDQEQGSVAYRLYYTPCPWDHDKGSSTCPVPCHQWGVMEVSDSQGKLHYRISTPWSRRKPCGVSSSPSQPLSSSPSPSQRPLHPVVWDTQPQDTPGIITDRNGREVGSITMSSPLDQDKYSPTFLSSLLFPISEFRPLSKLRSSASSDTSSSSSINWGRSSLRLPSGSPPALRASLLGALFLYDLAYYDKQAPGI